MKPPAADPPGADRSTAGRSTVGRSTVGRSAVGRSTVYDPLRLCVYATIAVLAWLLGPVVVLAFAAVGFLAYWRARRAGLTRSRCILRDTRLVLAYLGVIGLAAVVGLAVSVHAWLG